MTARKAPAPKSPRKRLPRIVLRDLGPQEARPKLAVYALDAALRPLATAPVDDQGQYDLPEEAIRRARTIAVGPAVEKFDAMPRDVLRRYRPADFLALDAIDLLKPDWGRWLFNFRCVSGSVRRCRLNPWYYGELIQYAEAAPRLLLRSSPTLKAQLNPEVSASIQADLGDLRAYPGGLYWPGRCSTICEGTVAVYERVCCRPPWVIEDPRLPDLLDELGKIIVQRPPIKFPPPPPPPPPDPWLKTPYIKRGALDLRAINARRDLAALQALPRVEQAAYLQARPYLWPAWECGAAKHVGQGTLNPDGKFTVCWLDFPIILDFCVRQYAFVVTQIINGSPVVIYDGLAANAWFSASDDITLTSYHPWARACRGDEFPLPGAYVLLEHIGDADSWRLQTPAATGWDRVAVPAATDGLADAAANPHAAGLNPQDRNWGGSLYLQYLFSEEMYGVGARYYRVSVCAADSNGNPTGARTDFTDGLSWAKWVAGNNVSQTLGPTTVGTENNLYQIPFDAILGPGQDWEADQYHAWINTTALANGRYLVTIEIFDGAGNRLRPSGVPADPALPSTAAPFTFRRWHAPTNVPNNTSPVPYAALTHLFWWDNSRAEGDIVDLRHNGAPSTDECQFLCTNHDSDTFSVGYQAYFPGQPLFLWYHTLNWYRGLSATSQPLAIAGPGNIGEPPSPVGVSGTATFSTMLCTNASPCHDRCSFSVNLNVYVKTFNGFGRLSGNDDWDTAAFALQIGHCGPGGGAGGGG